jgi:hypothetical protein
MQLPWRFSKKKIKKKLKKDQIEMKKIAVEWDWQPWSLVLSLFAKPK